MSESSLIIPRTTLLTVWQSQPRQVPTDVMVTSAEMEDSPKTPWGTYLVTSERFEAQRHQKKKRQFPTRPTWKDTSYGIFQALGEFLPKPYQTTIKIWEVHEACKAGAFDPIQYLKLQCDIYDIQMSAHVSRRGIPACFKAYNGWIDGYDDYLNKAIGFLERVRAEL